MLQLGVKYFCRFDIMEKLETLKDWIIFNQAYTKGQIDALSELLKLVTASTKKHQTDPSGNTKVLLDILSAIDEQFKNIEISKPIPSQISSHS